MTTYRITINKKNYRDRIIRGLGSYTFETMTFEYECNGFEEAYEEALRRGHVADKNIKMVPVSNS